MKVIQRIWSAKIKNGEIVLMENKGEDPKFKPIDLESNANLLLEANAIGEVNKKRLTLKKSFKKEGEIFDIQLQYIVK